MERENIEVVVVDDDFMIAQIHRDYVDSLDGFQVMNVARTGAETLNLLSRVRPDLVLLDVYLPDKSGIEVLNEIRLLRYNFDVILVTAANQLVMVQEGFRLGIFDYLIKPFNLDALGLSLQKYKLYHAQLASPVKVTQDTVDKLKKLRATELAQSNNPESGIDLRTLERVQEALASFDYASSSDEIARSAGVSRSTARTYLDYMVEKGLAEERLSYGSVGRPRRLFRKR